MANLDFSVTAKDIALKLLGKPNSPWTDYNREALFIESNGGLRQVVFLANNEDNVPLVMCNMKLSASEIPHISVDIFRYIGEHICLYNTYNGVKIIKGYGIIPQRDICEISLLELEYLQ